jgi:hypothetical protein
VKDGWIGAFKVETSTVLLESSGMVKGKREGLLLKIDNVAL